MPTHRRGASATRLHPPPATRDASRSLRVDPRARNAARRGRHAAAARRGLAAGYAARRTARRTHDAGAAAAHSRVPPADTATRRAARARRHAPYAECIAAHDDAAQPVCAPAAADAHVPVAAGLERAAPAVPRARQDVAVAHVADVAAVCGASAAQTRHLCRRGARVAPCDGYPPYECKAPAARGTANARCVPAAQRAACGGGRACGGAAVAAAAVAVAAAVVAAVECAGRGE